MITTNFLQSFKKWQAVLGAVIAILTLYFGHSLQKPKLMVALLGGFLIGYTLTRSRFGFAGGIKRIYVRGEGSLTKAILIALAVTAVLYGIVQYAAYTKGAVPAFSAKSGEGIIPGTQNVYMANIGTVIGGFVFGIGMIIAGGCASGTLSDFGEGEGHAIIAFPLFVLFTIPGHLLREIVDRNPIGKIGVKGYLPNYFGYLGALLVTLLALFVLYYITKKYEKKRKAEKTYLQPKSDYLDFEKELEDTVEMPSGFWALYHKVFVERWPFKTGAFVLSVVSAGLLIFNGKAWGVTSAFTSIPNFSISGWVFLVAISLGAVVSLKIFEGGVSCLIPARHRDPEDFK